MPWRHATLNATTAHHKVTQHPFTGSTAFMLGNEGKLVNDVVADKAHARVVANNVKTLGVLKYKSSMSLCNATNVTKMKDDEFGTLNAAGSRAWIVMIIFMPSFHPSITAIAL